MASNQTHPHRDNLQIALAGMLALSIAMGIGRFSFTPILPVMQGEGLLTITLSGWLASSNYLGYLIGGLTARYVMHRPIVLIRTSLCLVAATSLWMGFTTQYEVWLLVRLVSGAASAWMLVSVSSLCMPKLTSTPRIASLVFTGVGNGISMTGLVCLGLIMLDMTANAAWIITGLIAICIGGVIWPTFSDKRFTQANKRQPLGAAKTAPTQPDSTTTRQQRILIWCYGISGFGYIIPATFLPAQARDILGDTPLFGLAWPVFGIASAVMVFLGGMLSARWGRIRTWMGAHFVMAIGVAIPTLWPGLGGILASALCVGGTFVAVTLIAMQHAQMTFGPEAPGMMVKLTTAYATGQILGPVFISLLSGNMSLALWIAAAALALSVWLLARLPRQTSI